jgi:hypothetical protein
MDNTTRNTENAEQPEPTSTETAEQAEPTILVQLIANGLIGVALFIGLMVYNGDFGGSEEAANTQPTSASAQTVAPAASPATILGSDDPWDPHCRRAILGQLREPSSATIVYDGLNKPDGAAHKRVSAEADARIYDVSARNGSGGMARRTWSCERIYGSYWVIER